MRGYINLDMSQPASAYLPFRVESKKAMVQPYSKMTNLPQPNNGPENDRKNEGTLKFVL